MSKEVLQEPFKKIDTKYQEFFQTECNGISAAEEVGLRLFFSFIFSYLHRRGWGHSYKPMSMPIYTVSPTFIAWFKSL